MKSTMKFHTLVIAAMLAATAFLSGCATSEKIQTVQAGDDQLNCSQISSEFAKLDKAQSEIESKKGVTGTNVASALLFLPGLAYTYYDAGEASKLIYDRRSNLTALANKKRCPASVAKNEPEADMDPAAVQEVVAAKKTAPEKKKSMAKKPVADKQ